jgi:hypothetical protein
MMKMTFHDYGNQMVVKLDNQTLDAIQAWTFLGHWHGCISLKWFISITNIYPVLEVRLGECLFYR